MKKILALVLMVLSVSVFADYAYKMTGGKVGKLKVITAAQTAEYTAKGYTIETSTLTMNKILTASGQSEVIVRLGVIPSIAERTLADSSFDQGDIRRACRRIVIVPAVIANPAATPPIAAVAAVTLEIWLDALINSSPENQKDWVDEKLINLDDPRVVNALAASQLPVTILDIKREIAKDRRVF